MLYTRNQNHIWKVLYTHTKEKQTFIMVLVISTGKRETSYEKKTNMTKF